MGYTIVYDRRFIRTTRGIIPVCLAGSNNCTEFINGREVLERSWFPFYSSDLIELPEDNLLQKVEKLTSAYPEGEAFKWHGDWVLNKNLSKWFKRGINDALTIEEYIANNPYQSLMCELSIWSRGETYEHKTALCSPYIKTTKDLESWLDEAYIQKSKLVDKEVFVMVSFNGREPLKSQSKKIEGPVVVKYRNKYLSEYVPGKTYTYSPKVKEAIIFSSPEEAKDLMENNCGEFKFVSAKTALKTKPFVIQMEGGTWPGFYVRKRSSRHLYYAHTIDGAMHFDSEKKAEQYIEKLRGPFPEHRVGKYCIVKKD